MLSPTLSAARTIKASHACPAHQAQAGRFEMAQRARLFADDAGGRYVVFGITAGAVEDLRRVPDFVSGGESRHAGADRFDYAGDVMSGDGRQLHQILIVAASDLIIQWVDRGRVYPDQHLSRFRHGFGHVAERERFRVAK